MELMFCLTVRFGTSITKIMNIKVFEHFDFSSKVALPR
jgi:hypothetical protein